MKTSVYSFAAQLGILLLIANPAAQGQIRLERGMVITTSSVVEPRDYFISSDSTGAIVIRGHNIEVDFRGARLIGASDSQSPDTFTGTGIRIEGSNITVRNAVVRGYKLGIWATNSNGLRITASDLSYNYRQRLKSTIEREHLDDWMSYHTNENDEWMRYGAAIYIADSDSVSVDSAIVTGGQNGLMLTNVNQSAVFANAFTFNSGIGIGMYRSSNNKIQHNRLDWNVRGYSDGVYHRGQDSAAILMYEQSSDNTIAYNSATHSGDGLFLWAGQSTMDSGEGGCNNNLIFGNDFSYAPTNGIEVTFSSNTIIANKIHGCWHGIWGGYSYRTSILGNSFADNDEHIAIEHGQFITIEENSFTGGDIGVRVWERDKQPEDWGYTEKRDVSSRRFAISGNEFDSVSVPVDIRDTERVDLQHNVFKSSFETLRLALSPTTIKYNSFPSYAEPTEAPIEGEYLNVRDNVFGHVYSTHVSLEPDRYAPAPIGSLGTPTIPEEIPIGRRFMMIDEWGPYDFRSPIFWPRTDRSQLVQHFESFGPDGEWRLVRYEGVDSVSAESGVIGDPLTIYLPKDQAVDVDLQFEFVGDVVVDRFGRENEEGRPYRFSYTYFSAPISWTTKFFQYNAETDPRSNYEAFSRLIADAPVIRQDSSVLAYQWYGSPAPGITADHFATVSTGRLEVPDGEYILDVTSDDGVRVWLDGKLIHDDWTYHAPRLASIPVKLRGTHEIRIEHFEIDGYSTLVAQIRRPAN